MNIAIHGIRTNHVRNAATFEDIYHDMLAFIDNNLLLAHNTSFDMYALNDSFKKYNLDIPELDYLCTYRLSKALYQLPSYRLNMMAEHFNIDNSNHHHALNDAMVCAYIAMEIIKDKNQDLIHICEESQFELGNLRRNGFVKKRSYKNSFQIHHNPELHDFNHIFYNKNICFTGMLKLYTRKEAAQIVSDLGAQFENSLNKNTDYLVVGGLEKILASPGKSKSSKLLKAEQFISQGVDIDILSEDDFSRLI